MNLGLRTLVNIVSNPTLVKNNVFIINWSEEDELLSHIKKLRVYFESSKEAITSEQAIVSYILNDLKKRIRIIEYKRCSDEMIYAIELERDELYKIFSKKQFRNIQIEKINK